MLIQTFETGMSFYVYMYGIVILIVAVLIANTLLMAVFERIREIGILAALGMKRRQITTMFLMEALILGIFGVILGNLIGAAGVAALAANGIPTGDMGGRGRRHGHRRQPQRRVPSVRHDLSVGLDAAHHLDRVPLPGLVRRATRAGGRAAFAIGHGSCGCNGFSRIFRIIREHPANPYHPCPIVSAVIQRQSVEPSPFSGESKWQLSS